MKVNDDVVLAFSGGLDTSFCVPWLRDRGHRVTTLFVDTGDLIRVDTRTSSYVSRV